MMIIKNYRWSVQGVTVMLHGILGLSILVLFAPPMILLTTLWLCFLTIAGWMSTLSSLVVNLFLGGKERIQIFQGNIVAITGSGIAESYTVRKLSYGVGVERTFPLHSPSVAKLEVLKRGDVRRAKLNYLRDRKGKSAKIREKRDDQ